jgi:hypothetical protein
MKIKIKNKNSLEHKNESQSPDTKHGNNSCHNNN